MPRAESRPESGEWIAVERRRTDGKRKQLSAEAKKNSRNQAGNALSLVDDGLHSYCKNPIWWVTISASNSVLLVQPHADDENGVLALSVRPYLVRRITLN